MRNDHLQSHNEAFMQYYEKYADDIFRFCMVKTSNRDQALDLTQETFMKFWEYLVDGNDVSNHRALLYRIANNLVIDSYRKKKDVLVEKYTDTPLQEELTDEPQKRMEDMIDGERAVLLLHHLPETTREILTLRFLDDLSVSEIASIVNRDSKTVSVYLHRGIKKLQEILNNHG
jgi:RNA polymerase sigma-70 factor (ECF subfamily)